MLLHGGWRRLTSSEDSVRMYWERVRKGLRRGDSKGGYPRGRREGTKPCFRREGIQKHNFEMLSYAALPVRSCYFESWPGKGDKL